MECALCTLWARMPYAKKYTTPTTAQETEQALIIGFWSARRHEDTVPRLCEGHMHYLEQLDIQEQQRVADEAAKAKQAAEQKKPPQPAFIMNYQKALQEQKQTEGGFTLGPGPLPNENTITATPPLPVGDNTIAPYQQETSIIKPMPPVGSPEAAIEAAKLPPTPGQPVSLCPLCGKHTMPGEVHSC